MDQSGSHKNKPTLSYYTSKKKRPLTPSSFQKINDVIDLYAYNDTKKQRKKDKKNTLHQKSSAQQNSRARRSFTIGVNKDRQQLYEENIAIKREANKLQEELLILKGKNETSWRRKLKKSQKLGLEFEKQIYWTGSNSYLIQGIKYQYEKLKKNYELKCQENEELKREIIKTRIPELLIYNEMLQTQNRRLCDEVQKVDKGKGIQSQNLMDQEKIKTLKMKIKEKERELEEKEKKILFLEKLVIKKQNDEFKADQRYRRKEKQRNLAVQENQSIKQKLSIFEQEEQMKISLVKRKLQQKIEFLKNEHRKQIQEKQQKIQELEDHIRNLDEAINDFHISNTISPENKMDFNSLLMAKQSKIHKPSKSAENPVDQKIYLQTIAMIVKQVEDINARPKVQKKADQPQTKNSKKVRKLEFSEIEDIVEYLKFRLVEAEIHLSQIKSYFNFDNSENILNQDMQWEEEYVTMKQVRNILKTKPFGLNEDDAFLLARYLIEDADGEYIYCDLVNEQKRQIVKSIMNSLLKDYQLCSPQVKNEYAAFLTRYTGNIVSALKTICPSGKVSMKKFIQIIDGLGIQASDSLKYFVISKLAVHSQNLKALNYGLIFRQVEE